MKVLVLNGSPRKGGNCEILLEETIKAVKDQGHEVMFYHLNSLAMSPCQHCGGCDNSGRCIIEDDVQIIHNHIETTDRIIVASPVFFYNVTAQLKILIDRSQPFWSQKYVHKKPLTGGMYGRKGLLLLVGAMKMTEKNEGFHCSEVVVRAFFRSVSVPEHVTLSFDNVDEKGAIRSHPTALQAVYDAAKRLVT